MAIDRRLNGHDLTSADLYVAAPPRPEAFAIATRPRVGVDYAGAWARRLLRFYIRGNAHVSRP
jgi:DNA-3-methyladenine glycosylase